KQLRGILRKVKKALDRVTDALLQLPKNAMYQIGVELEGIPRLVHIDERVATTYPQVGVRKLVKIANATGALSESISRTLIVFSSKGGPIRNRADTMLLLDLAELYEWLTGKSPTRKTRSHKHTDVGKHFGEFHEFTKFFWFAYHKSYRGLDGAFKAWATQRNRGARKSQYLNGLLHHHPEWQ